LVFLTNLSNEIDQSDKVFFVETGQYDVPTLRFPTAESVKACAPRLRELVTIARPKLVVCVGQVARDWIDPKNKNCVLPMLAENGIRTIDIVHPAAILRANIAQRGLMIQRAVAALSTAVEDL
jgi:uracil-DNA glycosylase family 4